MKASGTVLASPAATVTVGEYVYVPPTYKPEVTQPDEGGSVAVSPANPRRGDEVTITPKPDEGYAVDEVAVTDPSAWYAPALSWAVEQGLFEG